LEILLLCKTEYATNNGATIQNVRKALPVALVIANFKLFRKHLTSMLIAAAGNDGVNGS
jgi:alkylhydroperoxidase/carboxymuconolactone decarboxylase family protein YurZ